MRMIKTVSLLKSEITNEIIKPKKLKYKKNCKKVKIIILVSKYLNF
jgi:hypothetical protein